MFATVEDLRKSWRTWPENLETETAEGKLEEASDWLNAEYDVPEQPVPKLARALRIVVMAMAKRALLGDGHEGVAGDMKVAGNFTHQQQFRNAEGALFLTGQERQMLENALGASAGAVSMEARGW